MLATIQVSPTDPDQQPGISSLESKTPRSVQDFPAHRVRRRALLWGSGVCGALALCCGIYILRDYLKLSRVVDAQLERGPYARTINFYAAPESIDIGDLSSPVLVAQSLRRAGFQENASSGGASFKVAGDTIFVCDPRSEHPAVEIQLRQGAVFAMLDQRTGAGIDRFALEPALVNNVSSDGRERRVIVHFSDIPPVLIDAVTSAEDKHFFRHGGYDPLRIAKAMYIDAKTGRKEQGASTISMQLARNLYLNPEKRWRRKFTEFLITLHLEHALTKQQIFEYYANQVFLGGYGTFTVNGFGEAAHAYFNKSLQRLDVPEAAMLAGLIQRPSYFNPFRYPDRARERRNVVLRLMRANRYISDAELDAAVASPLTLDAGKSEVSQTQYAMDFANAEFQKTFEGQESSGITNVYTSIDLRLQQAAEQSISEGLEQVDRLLSKRRGIDGKSERAQAALIALDPRTGAIKAVVGGRDYSVSQLNRVLAHRPPGSVFKPFVYAAALNTAIEGGEHVLTPASMVDDSPTTFHFDNQTYKPNDFKHEYHGMVTFRQALAKSMNVAAVKVGEMAGFDSVVSLARQAGMEEDIRPTPAVALGAYAVTPLEIARAYTAFANGGLMSSLSSVGMIADQNGQELYRTNTTAQRVLDPRVNFQLVDMMQDVLKYGTAAGVRSRGFLLPAAGKTGTSHDGWFAGFTSQLLCVVWVGFDDYRELGLEGARSALPIWTSFMSQAAHYQPYRDARPFPQPEGLIRTAIDPTTGLRPTAFCPLVVTDYFIDGTQPNEICMEHQATAVPVLPVQPVPLLPVSGTILTPPLPSNPATN